MNVHNVIRVHYPQVHCNNDWLTVHSSFASIIYSLYYFPRCYSPSTPMTAPLGTLHRTFWSVPTTPPSLAWSRMVTSPHTDRNWSSWSTGAVRTTWSWTHSILWSWQWTSGATHRHFTPSSSSTMPFPPLTSLSSRKTQSPRDLKWSTHINSVQKKDQHIPTLILCAFYT